MANNALGVAGVAGRVRLLGCKAIAGLDGHLVTSAAVRCLEYCASAGAHITSNSWGGQVRPSQTVSLCHHIRLGSLRACKVLFARHLLLLAQPGAVAATASVLPPCFATATCGVLWRLLDLGR